MGQQGDEGMSYSGNWLKDIELMWDTSMYGYISEIVNREVDNDPMVQRAKCERDLSLFINQSPHKYRAKSHMLLALDSL